MSYGLIMIAFGISAVTLWQRHIILYIGAFVSLLLIGLHFAQTSWLQGLPVLFIAGYMLWESIAYWFRR